MEKKLNEIIRKHENNLSRYVNQRNDLRNKIRFCSLHNFEEEQRISQLKVDAMDMVIYDFQFLIEDLKKINQPPKTK